MDALDSNDDGAINKADAIYTLYYMFRDGPAPLSPYLQEGHDFNGPDELRCIY